MRRGGRPADHREPFLWVTRGLHGRPSPQIHWLAYEITQPIKANHTTFRGGIHSLCWPTVSVECFSLNKSTSYISLCLSMNSFCNEMPRTSNPLGPETRLCGFWLGLNHDHMGSSPIWGKQFHFVWQKDAIFTYFRFFAELCFFHYCFHFLSWFFQIIYDWFFLITLQNFAVFCQTSTWISHILSLLNLPHISLPIQPH